jgi:hypothetical protein
VTEPEKSFVQTPNLKFRLVDIAHARSGDKGDWVDFGLFAWDAAGYAVLARVVTAEAVRQHFAPWLDSPSSGAPALDVTVWPLPNLLAFKIVIKNALQGGAASNLRQDNLGKAMAGALLRMPISLTDAERSAVRAHE